MPCWTSDREPVLDGGVAAAAPSSRVIGIDAAAPYVGFAQGRHTGDSIRFEAGDAQELRFLDGSFDRTLSLVLNFIPDPAKALDEMIRGSRMGLRTGKGDVARVLGRGICAQ
jgi:ubiquinone/menaquinone biosynthesis C-methylase UbiE